MKSDVHKIGREALIAQLRSGLLREAYQRKLVTENQYIKLAEQRRGQ